MIDVCTRQAILSERVRVELEVRPKFLVADTNCYIDHLDSIVRLTREKHYTLVAPLVGTLDFFLILTHFVDKRHLFAPISFVIVVTTKNVNR